MKRTEKISLLKSLQKLSVQKSNSCIIWKFIENSDARSLRKPTSLSKKYEKCLILSDAATSSPPLS